MTDATHSSLHTFPERVLEPLHGCQLCGRCEAADDLWLLFLVQKMKMRRAKKGVIGDNQLSHVACDKREKTNNMSIWHDFSFSTKRGNASKHIPLTMYVMHGSVTLTCSDGKWLQPTITARGSYRFSRSWYTVSKNAGWKLVLSPAKHESLRYSSFNHHIYIDCFKDEFTEIIKWRPCKITAIEEKKQNIRSCCGWSKVHCLLWETQCAVLRVKTVYLVDTHPGSWINIKSSVILMRLLNHAGLGQTVQHPSRRAVKFGILKKKKMHRKYTEF